ncbi:hypothetical protein D3C73_1596470 [compost metagenome]
MQESKRIKLFDPVHPYIYKFVAGYEAVRLLRPVFREGEPIGTLPDLQQIRDYHRK